MDFTIPQMWASMGVIAKTVVVILGIMSVFVVAIGAERWYVFGAARRQSRSYALILQDLLGKGRFKEAAEAAKNYKKSHIASVVRSGLDEFIKGQLIASGGKVCYYNIPEAVKMALEKTNAREMAGMRRGLAGLATVGSTAPFVGLFGTVFGIINSFQGMAKNEAGGIGAVSAGIAEALITTAVGIGVAIVAVLLYNYFTSRVDGLAVDSSESALEILDILVKNNPEAKA